MIREKLDWGINDEILLDSDVIAALNADMSCLEIMAHDTTSIPSSPTYSSMPSLIASPTSSIPSIHSPVLRIAKSAGLQSLTENSLRIVNSSSRLSVNI